MRIQNNLILVDNEIPENWEFLQAIEDSTGEKWIVRKNISNENFGGFFQNLIRYVKYFWLPLKVAFTYKRYKKVLAWQQFYGLILAFYFRLFHVRNTPEIYVVSFIYKPKKSIIGVFYKKFMSYIVTSGYITKFIIHSVNEKKIYSNEFNILEDKFKTIVLGDEDHTQIIPAKYGGDFFLAAGRSNRDYSFLLDAWKNRPEHLKVISDTLNQISSSNIEILNKCYEDEYFKQLSQCYAVIIPLEDTNISSGQLVVIQSMMYGKPIIITQNDTIELYVKNDETGLVISKTQEELFEAIEKIKDPSLYYKISKNQRKEYEENFSFYALGKSIGMLMVES